MARMPCSHFFVAWLVHTPFVCVIALLVHLRQVHPLCVRYCFVGAAETSAPPLCAFVALLVQRRQVHPLMLIILLLSAKTFHTK